MNAEFKDLNRRALGQPWWLGPKRSERPHSCHEVLLRFRLYRRRKFFVAFFSGKTFCLTLLPNRFKFCFLFGGQVAPTVTPATATKIRCVCRRRGTFIPYLTFGPNRSHCDHTKQREYSQTRSK